MIAYSAQFPGAQRLIDGLNLRPKIDRQMPLLMDRVAKIIVEDNRKGVLEGTDCHDHVMPAVTYRGGSRAKTSANRGDRFGVKAGIYKGPKAIIGGKNFGLFNIGGKRVGGQPGNGNLTTAEYRKLNGPPLAPRGEHSRVITNLYRRFRKDGDGIWVAEAYWLNVVSSKKFPFLSAHFLGKGRLPVRNLAGVRQWGRNRIRKEARDWLREQLKGI